MKVIEIGTVRKLAYDFLFAFHGNYGCILSRFDTIDEHHRLRRRAMTARVVLYSLARLQLYSKNGQMKPSALECIVCVGRKARRITANTVIFSVAAQPHSSVEH